MENLLELVNVGVMQTRIIMVSFVIIVNLIVSVIESLKMKKFDVKKLPEFISEWMMCVCAIFVMEVVISLISADGMVLSLMTGVRDIMLISILGCYLKKIFESFKAIGWDVNINKINDKLDNQ